MGLVWICRQWICWPMWRSFNKRHWQLMLFEQTATRYHLQTQTSLDKNRPLHSLLWASTLSSHSLHTYSLHGSLPWPHSPTSDLLKRKKKKCVQAEMQPDLSSARLLPVPIYFLNALPAAYMTGTTRQQWCRLSLMLRHKFYHIC